MLCTIVLQYLVLHTGGQIDRQTMYLDQIGQRIEERELLRRELQGELIKNIKYTTYKTPFDCAKGPGER